MPHLGFPEMLVLLVIVLLLFGAKRVPEIGQSLGKGIRSFKDGLTTDSSKSDASTTEKTPEQPGS